MCGRARCSLAREAVLTAAGVSEQRWRNEAQYRPSYNCSPGAWIPVIKLGADGFRELQTMKWGLVPGFTRLGPSERPDHFRMFNARSESLAQKPVFSRLLPGKRCVVLLDGFYEWHSQGGVGGGAASRKQPYHITTADGTQHPAMYLAGLYDLCHDAYGEALYTFTIITTDSSKPLAWLHDRMPVILTTEEEVSAWLGEGNLEGKTGTEAVVKAEASGKQQRDEVECHSAAATLEPPGSPHSRLQTGAAAAVKTKTADDLTASGSANTSNTPSSTAGQRRPSFAATSVAFPYPASETKEAKASGAADTIEILSGDDEEDKMNQYGGGFNKEVASGDENQSSKGHIGSSYETAKGREHEGRRGGAKGEVQFEGNKRRGEALVEKICQSYGGPLLRWHPVTPEMSKPGYDKPDCCKDVRTKKGSIGSFFKPAAPKASSGAASAAAPLAATIVKHESQKSQTQQDPEKVKKQEVRDAAWTDAAVRNPDDCAGADGSVYVGQKRQAES